MQITEVLGKALWKMFSTHALIISIIFEIIRREGGGDCLGSATGHST